MHRSKASYIVIQLSSAAVLLTLLSGCTNPSTLGLNHNQWNRLSPDQQKDYVSAYRGIEKNLEMSSKLSPTKQQASPKNADAAPLPDIDVTILNGQAAFSSHFLFSPITPLHVHLHYGVCQWALLESSDQKQSSKLWFCYVQKTLGIDPSLYKMDQAWGTAFIDVNPLWNRGFTYKHVYTSGYTRLSDATINIQANSPIALTPPPSESTEPAPEEQTHAS
jgi:hypothetical protein